MAILVVCAISGSLPALAGWSGTWTTPAVSEPNANLDGNIGPNGWIGGVSCASAGNCTAVGAFNDSADHVQGYVVEETSGVWGGGQVAPLPSDATSDPGVELRHVACSSPGNCSAFGVYDNADGLQGLLLTESNGVWSAERAAPPSGATNPIVYAKAISCTSPGNCVAVGRYEDDSGYWQGLIATQSSGSWSFAQASAPGDASATPEPDVMSVSCPSAGSCVAVGDYRDASGDRVAMLLTLASGTWSAETAPLPADAEASHSSSATAVFCSSAGRCSAAGQYLNDTLEQVPLLLTGSSGSWTATSADLPADWTPGTSNPAATATAITCTSAGNCAAIGEYTADMGNQQGVLLEQSSGVWAASGTTAPQPSDPAANPLSSLSGISCVSAGNCVAVGTYTDDRGLEQGLVVTEASGSWGGATRPPVPGDADPSSPDAALAAVSCVSSGACSAGGAYYQNLSGYELPNLLTGTPGALSSTAGTFPSAVHAQPGYVSAVACASAGNCAVVGTYRPGESDHGLIAEETSGTWREVRRVLPSDAAWGYEDHLVAVACPSAGNCTAVGTYQEQTANMTFPLLLTETSGVWGDGETVSFASLDTMGGDPQAHVAAVACLSAGNCAAVGYYTDSSNRQQGLLLTQVSGSWSAEEAVPPANANAPGNAFVTFSGVSCAGTRCVAVGSYQDTNSDVHGLLDVFAAGAWRDGAEAAAPSGGTQEDLLAVSCATAGHCRVAGIYSDTSNDQQPVLLTETAADTWSVVEGRLPADALTTGTPQTNITSLSCASDNCTAVGTYLDDAGHRQVLVLSQRSSGTWAQGPELALPPGGDATQSPGPTLDAVSCLAAGHCTAVGSFEDGHGDWHGMTASETAGTWGSLTASALPGDADSTYPEDRPVAVACPSSGACLAAGSYYVPLAMFGGTLQEPLLLQRDAAVGPAVSGVSPTAGTADGGTTVTITGTNLDGVTAVSFGSTSATSFAGVSDTQVTAVAPAHGTGTVDVTVTTVFGTSATSASDRFTYTAPAPAPTTTTTSTTTTTAPATTTTPTTSSSGGGTTTTTTTTTTQPTASVSPGESGSLSTGTGGESVTVSWQPDSIPEAATITMTLAPVSGTPVVFQAGTLPVQLTVTATDGTPITSFTTPLEILFPGAPVGFEPAYSSDGKEWVNVPQLAGPTLPPGFVDGWYRDESGTIHILTLHATYFAMVDVESAEGIVDEAQEVVYTYTHPLRLARTRVLTVSVRPELPSLATAVLRRDGRIVVMAIDTAPADLVRTFRLRLPAHARPGTYRLTVAVYAEREHFVRVVPVSVR